MQKLSLQACGRTHHGRWSSHVEPPGDPTHGIWKRELAQYPCECVKAAQVANVHHNFYLASQSNMGK